MNAARPGIVEVPSGTPNSLGDGEVAARQKLTEAGLGPSPKAFAVSPAADGKLVDAGHLPPPPPIDGAPTQGHRNDRAPNAGQSGDVHGQPSGPSQEQASKDPFATLKPGETKTVNGVAYTYKVDSDGTQHRITGVDANTGTEETIRPDKSRDLVTQRRGFRETQSWDENGTLRQDNLSTAKTLDGKSNFDSEKSWDKNGRPEIDNARWQDSDGIRHQDNTSNYPDGTIRHETVDGERTDTKLTKPDGSWTDELKIRDGAETIDPGSGRHYKTMKIVRSHSDPVTGKPVIDPGSN
jgi:hypothetical protein